MFGSWLLLAFFALTFSSYEAVPFNQRWTYVSWRIFMLKLKNVGANGDGVCILLTKLEPPVWPEEFAAKGLITHNGQTLFSFTMIHSQSKQSDRYDLVGSETATTIFNIDNEEVGFSMTQDVCYFFDETENPYGIHSLLPDLKGFKLLKNVGVYMDGSLVQDWRDPEGNYGAYVERKGIYGIPKAIWGPKWTTNFTKFQDPYKSRCAVFDFTRYEGSCKGLHVSHAFKCVD